MQSRTLEALRPYQERVTELEERVRELEKDKARLDWLESKHRGIDTYYNEDEHRNEFCVEEFHPFQEWRPNIRAAIDAAIDADFSEAR